MRPVKVRLSGRAEPPNESNFTRLPKNVCRQPLRAADDVITARFFTLLLQTRVNM